MTRAIFKVALLCGIIATALPFLSYASEKEAISNNQVMNGETIIEIVNLNSLMGGGGQAIPGNCPGNPDRIDPYMLAEAVKLAAPLYHLTLTEAKQATIIGDMVVHETNVHGEFKVDYSGGCFLITVTPPN